MLEERERHQKLSNELEKEKQHLLSLLSEQDSISGDKKDLDELIEAVEGMCLLLLLFRDLH